MPAGNPPRYLLPHGKHRNYNLLYHNNYRFFQNNHSKWELFRQADLFILPTHSENFGIVVAEALASGTPVVTTMGTPWSELESRRCGWWTEVGTEATVQALRNFLSLTENELEKMGRNGRKLVEEKYSAHKVAEEFVEMYKSIL